MEEGLQAAGCQWDAGQPATGTAASFGGLRGSSNSKDSTQTEAGIDPTPRRKPGRPPQTKTCRVCALDLAEAGLKGYYLRYRICPEHRDALAVDLRGEQQRFCQQCGTFHPVSEFSGDRRSCRDRLRKLAMRRRKASDASGSRPASWHWEEEQDGGQEAEGEEEATDSEGCEQEVEDGCPGGFGSPSLDGVCSPSPSKRSKLESSPMEGHSDAAADFEMGEVLRSSCGSQSSVQQAPKQELLPKSLPFAASGWPWMREVQAASQHTRAAGQAAVQQQQQQAKQNVPPAEKQRHKARSLSGSSPPSMVGPLAALLAAAEAEERGEADEQQRKAAAAQAASWAAAGGQKPPSLLQVLSRAAAVATPAAAPAASLMQQPSQLAAAMAALTTGQQVQRQAAGSPLLQLMVDSGLDGATPLAAAAQPLLLQAMAALGGVQPSALAAAIIDQQREQEQRRLRQQQQQQQAEQLLAVLAALPQQSSQMSVLHQLLHLSTSECLQQAAAALALAASSRLGSASQQQPGLAAVVAPTAVVSPAAHPHQTTTISVAPGPTQQQPAFAKPRAASPLAVPAGTTRPGTTPVAISMEAAAAGASPPAWGGFPVTTGFGRR